MRITALTRCALIALMTLSASVAHATSYNVVGLGDKNGPAGFTANVLHAATGCSDMCGATLAQIDAATGNYNSTTGAFNMTLSLSTGDTVQLQSGDNVFFSGGVLNPSANLDLVVPDPNSISGYAGGTYDLSFPAGYVCCGDSGFAPNSLIAGTGADSGLMIMTLWGAGPLAGVLNGDKLGIDLRVKLEAVPLPGALILFATGLLSLFGLRRRHQMSAQFT